MIDIFIVSDKNLSPVRCHREIAPNFQIPVRSVTTLNRTTGLTGTFRDDEAMED